MSKNSGKKRIPTLTYKQELYAQGIAMGKKNREAYMEAYNTENMADNSIDVQACLLKKKPHVAARIIEIRNEIMQRNIVTVDRVIEELSHMAFDDISNYLDFNSITVNVGTEEKPVYQNLLNVNIKDSENIDTRNIQEIKLDSRGNMTFKLYAKDNALIQLGKHLGMFNDKVEVTGKDGGPVEVDIIRDKLIERLSKKVQPK